MFIVTKYNNNIKIFKNKFNNSFNNKVIIIKVNY